MLPSGGVGFVSYSFDDEFSILNTNVKRTHYLLAGVNDLAHQCRFYVAGSSEMLGKAQEVPQKDTTSFHPRFAYGISKVAGFDLTRNCREARGLPRVGFSPYGRFIAFTNYDRQKAMVRPL